MKKMSRVLSMVVCALTLSLATAKAQELAPESQSNSSYAIDASGNLYSWGDNEYGQLGTGNTTQELTPIEVAFPTGVTSWTAMAPGGVFCLAVGNDGNLYSWGENGYGNLGIGNYTNEYSPVKVPLPTGVTSWTAVAAGFGQALAIGSDGNLYAWGYNFDGELGIGSTTGQKSPVKVPLPSGVTAWTRVWAGGGESFAIGNDGNLYAWGLNTYGELGIGNTTTQVSPQKVSFPTGVTSWIELACGSDFTLAIGNDGNLYGWGENNVGQLGLANTTNQEVPQKIALPTAVTSWIAAAAGNDFAFAIGNDGNLYGWGDNYYGYLGIGTDYNSDVSPQIVSLPAGVTGCIAVTAGQYGGLAIGSDKNAYSWGLNNYGQCGINNTAEQLTPVLVHGVGNAGDLSLPVQATDFVATANVGSVMLSWNTQSEVDNAGFNVLREDPGTGVFKSIASVVSHKSLDL